MIGGKRVSDILGYQPPKAQRAKRRRWPSPPGIVFNLWVALLMLASMWVWRVPYGAFPFDLLLVVVWGVTGLAWLLAVLPNVRPLLASPAGRRRLAMWPLIMALGTAALVVTGVPRRAAFAISKPSLLTLAQNKTGPYKGWAGVYYVDRHHDDRGGVILRTNDIGLVFSTAGFAYFPNGAPQKPVGHPETFTPIGDGWYIYRFVD